METENETRTYIILLYVLHFVFLMCLNSRQPIFNHIIHTVNDCSLMEIYRFSIITSHVENYLRLKKLITVELHLYMFCYF